jgi:hypothetical protein
VTIDPAVLARHLTARLALMNRVAESRALLGLPELPSFELPEKEDGEPA